MSRTKDNLMFEENFPSAPREQPQDMLDIAIQKWIEATGDSGSKARVKIAMLAMRELAYYEGNANERILQQLQSHQGETD